MLWEGHENSYAERFWKLLNSFPWIEGTSLNTESSYQVIGLNPFWNGLRGPPDSELVTELRWEFRLGLCVTSSFDLHTTRYLLSCPCNLRHSVETFVQFSFTDSIFLEKGLLCHRDYIIIFCHHTLLSQICVISLCPWQGSCACFHPLYGNKSTSTIKRKFSRKLDLIQSQKGEFGKVNSYSFKHLHSGNKVGT